jgi:hypothetical protein
MSKWALNLFVVLYQFRAPDAWWPAHSCYANVSSSPPFYCIFALLCSNLPLPVNDYDVISRWNRLHHYMKNRKSLQESD